MNSLGEDSQERRSYDSPVRRKQTAETRERIVAAGAEILHGFPIWNWSALTPRAVAERSGVSERTVYRYFANERELRDAVMNHFAEEVRIDLENLRLEDLRDIAARIIDYTSSFPFEGKSQREPTLEVTHRRQQEALLAALKPATGGWSEVEREIAAAMLDVLWNYASYAVLVGDWKLESKQAAAGVSWVIGLVESAIRRGERPEV